MAQRAAGRLGPFPLLPWCAIVQADPITPLTHALCCSLLRPMLPGRGGRLPLPLLLLLCCCCDGGAPGQFNRCTLVHAARHAPGDACGLAQHGC